MTAPAARPAEISLWAGLKQIYAHMSARRRRQFFLLSGLLLAGAAAELATISAVIPFLALLARSKALHHSRLSFLDTLLSRHDGLILATATFIVFAIVAGLVRLQLAWSSRSFVLGFGHELAVEIQRRLIFQPFSFHIHRNTSSLMAGLGKVEMLVHDELLPLVNAVCAGVIAIFVVAILVFVDPIATFCAAVAFGVIYIAISVLTRKRLAAHSDVIETAYDDRLQTVQEGFGGIREVIIDNSQAMYLKEFTAVDLRLSTSRLIYQFISAAPRDVIEMLGMVVIAGIALFTAEREGGIAAALPTLGALVLGAQRLLPLVQQMYAGWSSITAQRSIFGQVVELLRLPLDEADETVPEPLVLRRGVGLENVSFTYATRSKRTLEDVSLTIPRGSMVALVGPTGSGKSTLVDLLMGLLQPDEGRVLIDEVPLGSATQRRWHRSIAHVPQSIFLADSTIARNIALSLPESPPDLDGIVKAAKKAQLHDFIVSLPSGYETLVGERGIRLSGGQRQRLGIARAIYKHAPVLVLDEATSALDELTERAVIGTLENLRREGRTIIIVAHRLSTIRHCDLVIRLEHGRVADFGPLNEVLDVQGNLAQRG